MCQFGSVKESLGVGGDVSYTCETAGHFFLYQIMARWENYSSKVKALANKVDGVVGCGLPWSCDLFSLCSPKVSLP